MLRTRRSALLPLEPDLSGPLRLRGVPGAVSRAMPAGAPLFPTGGPDGRLGWLLIVQSGILLVRWVARSGRSAVLSVAGPGEIVEEGGVWDGACLRPGPQEAGGGRAGPTSPPKATWSPASRALTSCRVLALEGRCVRRAVERDPIVAAWVAIAVARRVDRLQRSLARTLTLDVPERVLDTLRELACLHGTRVAGGMRIDLPLTQELLAQMIGSTRESVNRALRALESRRLVGKEGRALILRERASGYPWESWGGGEMDGPC